MSIGNQRISYRFSHPHEAKDMSYRFHGGVYGWKGIISGGWITKRNDSSVFVSPFVAEIPQEDAQYRIQTLSSAIVTGCSNVTPRLVVSFSYQRQFSNYATFNFLTSSATINENQIIIADLNFNTSVTPPTLSGGNGTSICANYDNRTLIEIGQVGTVDSQINGVGAIWMKDVSDDKLKRVVLSGGQFIFQDKS